MSSTTKKTIRAGDIIEYNREVWLVRALDEKHHTLVPVVADRKSVEPQYTVTVSRPSRKVAIIHIEASAIVALSYGD